MAVLLRPAVWERVMVIAPHPDDETLATGGLLQQASQRGAAVRIVYVTDGDNNPWPQRVIERRWHLTDADRVRWGARRRAEALAALATLAIPTTCATFLGYPDQGLTALLLSHSETLSPRLAALVADWRPTLLVGPSPRDAHPDHSAVALLIRRAVAQLSAECRPAAELNYLVHGHGRLSAGVRLPLTPEQHERKRAAILCYTSQMVLSRRRFLAHAAGTEPFLLPAAPTVVGDDHPSPEARTDPVTCCVIPCYNVAGLCEEVVRTAATYVDYLIAVNDGSTDDTGRLLDRIAQDGNGRVRVLTFARNRGKGAALLAAFRYALAEFPFDVLVTCDGDRQHRAADIPRLVRAWLDEDAALVIGEREAFAGMPLRNRLGNTITSTILRTLYPDSPRDTQSGLRALDRSFVEEVVEVVSGQRYETELDILLLALEERRHISTVPIPTIYLLGNHSSHYRPVRDSLRIYRTLLSRQLAHWRPGARDDRRAGEELRPTPTADPRTL